MRSSTRLAAAGVVAVAALVVVFLSIQALPVLPAGARGNPHVASGQGHGRLAPVRPVRISGDLPRPLVPGRTVRLNLYLRNPNPVPLAITRLRVRIIRVDAPNADAQHPCTRADFRVRPLTVRTAPRLAAHQGRHLRRLGVRPARRPAVRMLNLAVNQDGCQAATLTLSYTATARQVRR